MPKKAGQAEGLSVKGIIFVWSIRIFLITFWAMLVWIAVFWVFGLDERLYPKSYWSEKVEQLKETIALREGILEEQKASLRKEEMKEGVDEYLEEASGLRDSKKRMNRIIGVAEQEEKSAAETAAIMKKFKEMDRKTRTENIETMRREIATDRDLLRKAEENLVRYTKDSLPAFLRFNIN
jgi:hypothetical protein